MLVTVCGYLQCVDGQVLAFVSLCLGVRSSASLIQTEVCRAAAHWSTYEFDV